MTSDYKRVFAVESDSDESLVFDMEQMMIVDRSAGGGKRKEEVSLLAAPVHFDDCIFEYFQEPK